MANMLYPLNSLSILRGTNKTLLLKVSKDSLPVNLTAAVVHFTAKKDVQDTAPVIKKSSAVISEIEITAPLAGEAKIFLVPEDTRNLNSCQYVFDVWVVLANGERHCVVKPTPLQIEIGPTVLL